jgi:hypothetical protein
VVIEVAGEQRLGLQRGQTRPQTIETLGHLTGEFVIVGFDPELVGREQIADETL